jgi:hypothetical protein
MLWAVFFLAAFVILPIFLVVLLLRGNLSSFAKRHRALFCLFVGAGELALGVSKAVEGVTGVNEWVRLAWYFVSGVGFIGLAFKARQEDQALAIDSNPEGSVAGSGRPSG